MLEHISRCVINIAVFVNHLYCIYPLNYIIFLSTRISPPKCYHFCLNEDHFYLKDDCSDSRFNCMFTQYDSKCPQYNVKCPQHDSIHPKCDSIFTNSVKILCKVRQCTSARLQH